MGRRCCSSESSRPNTPPDVVVENRRLVEHPARPEHRTEREKNEGCDRFFHEVPPHACCRHATTLPLPLSRRAPLHRDRDRLAPAARSAHQDLSASQLVEGLHGAIEASPPGGEAGGPEPHRHEEHAQDHGETVARPEFPPAPSLKAVAEETLVVAAEELPLHAPPVLGAPEARNRVRQVLGRVMGLENVREAGVAVDQGAESRQRAPRSTPVKEACRRRRARHGPTEKSGNQRAIRWARLQGERGRNRVVDRSRRTLVRVRERQLHDGRGERRLLRGPDCDDGAIAAPADDSGL
jgi:hypothetical protein